MHETLLPLTVFAFVGSFTPGPNTMMSTASGTAFGFCRTIPQIVGVTIGFAVMIAAFGLGLAEVLRRYPDLQSWLKYVGAAYLIYLAVRIAMAPPPTDKGSTGRPFSFIEAALFQWLNPKAWTLALSVVTAFVSAANAIFDLAVIIVVFAVMTVSSLCVWCLFGVAIRRLLESPRALRITNLVMGALIALSVVMLFV